MCLCDCRVLAFLCFWESINWTRLGPRVGARLGFHVAITSSLFFGSGMRYIANFYSTLLHIIYIAKAVTGTGAQNSINLSSFDLILHQFVWFSGILTPGNTSICLTCDVSFALNWWHTLVAKANDIIMISLTSFSRLTESSISHWPASWRSQPIFSIATSASSLSFSWVFLQWA